MYTVQCRFEGACSAMSIRTCMQRNVDSKVHAAQSRFEHACSAKSIRTCMQRNVDSKVHAAQCRFRHACSAKSIRHDEMCAFACVRILGVNGPFCNIRTDSMHMHHAVPLILGPLSSSACSPCPKTQHPRSCARAMHSWLLCAHRKARKQKQKQRA